MDTAASQSELDIQIDALKAQVKAMRKDNRDKAKEEKDKVKAGIEALHAHRVGVIHSMPDDMDLHAMIDDCADLGIYTIGELFMVVRSRQRKAEPTPVNTNDRAKVLAWVTHNPGFSCGAIGTATGVDSTIPMRLVKSGELKTTGKGRGTRYHAV